MFDALPYSCLEILGQRKIDVSNYFISTFICIDQNFKNYSIFLSMLPVSIDRPLGSGSHLLSQKFRPMKGLANIKLIINKSKAFDITIIR